MAQVAHRETSFQYAEEANRTAHFWYLSGLEIDLRLCFSLTFFFGLTGFPTLSGPPLGFPIRFEQTSEQATVGVRCASTLIESGAGLFRDMLCDRSVAACL